MKEYKCSHFSKCGGCKFLNIKYEQELEQKKLLVEKCLQQYQIETKVESVVPMYFPYKYRNNVHLAVSEQNNKTVVGFFAENSKKVIDINDCLLFDDWLKNLVEIIRKYIRDFKISAYNPKTRSGILRYVVARNYKNHIIVTLVVTSQNFAGKNALYQMLKQRFSQVSLWLNINRRSDSAVFDNIFIHKYGEKKLNASLCGIDFQLSPRSFVQTNFQIASKIYSMVLEKILFAKRNAVIDLFSGIGITSCLFAKNRLDVLSIEMEKSSVLDAIAVQKSNGVANKVLTLCGRCEEMIQQILDFAKGKKVAVFVDPARNGIQNSVLQTILKIMPKKIVYMSCNPETLARDLSVLLKENKYVIENIIPFDMFPKTQHIEILSVLSQTNLEN